MPNNSQSFISCFQFQHTIFSEDIQSFRDVFAMRYRPVTTMTNMMHIARKYNFFPSALFFIYDGHIKIDLHAKITTFLMRVHNITNCSFVKCLDGDKKKFSLLPRQPGMVISTIVAHCFSVSARLWARSSDDIRHYKRHLNLIFLLY